MHMFTCAKCAEVLPDLIDGKGSSVLRSQLMEQTQQRAKCKHCVESYQKSATLTRHAYSNSEPPELCDHLLAFLRNHLNNY